MTSDKTGIALVETARESYPVHVLFFNNQRISDGRLTENEQTGAQSPWVKLVEGSEDWYIGARETNPCFATAVDEREAA